jgi:hypothetical protein
MSNELTDDEIKGLVNEAFGIDPILDGNLMRLARRAIAADRAKREAVQQARVPDGTWLWCELMDWCRKRGYPPAEYSDLLQIAGRAHKAAAPTPEEPT